MFYRILTNRFAEWRYGDVAAIDDTAAKVPLELGEIKPIGEKPPAEHINKPQKYKPKKKFKKLADVIIPHHNRHDRLKECLDSFTNEEFNIIIVSGGTFAENCNRGAKLAKTNNLIFLNDDIILSTRVLKELVSHKEDIVGVPCRIVDSGKIVYGMNMHWGKYGASNVLEGFDSVKTALEFNGFDKCKIPATGAFFLIKKKVWKDLGGFKECYKNGGEDNHLFLEALEKGYKIGHIDTICDHYHSSSEGRFDNDIPNHKTLTKHFPPDRLTKILGDKAMGELVSVIIPTTKKISPFCLKSIKNQTHKNLDIIVSRDLKKKGASWARNEGFKKAKGEYVFFCDDDVYLKPQTIEVMLNNLINSDYSFAYCNYDREGEIKGRHFSKDWDYNALKDFNYISTMSLIKREDFPGFDENLKRFQDWDLWLTIAEKGKTGIHINYTLFTAYYKKGDISCDKKTFRKSIEIIKHKHKL